jgi:hypothetical protein
MATVICSDCTLTYKAIDTMIEKINAGKTPDACQKQMIQMSMGGKLVASDSSFVILGAFGQINKACADASM